MVLFITIPLSILEPIKIVGVVIGVICAIWHASTLKVCERPLSNHDKKTLAKPLLIGGTVGMVVLMCLILRAVQLHKSFWQFILSVGAYKGLVVPFFWILVYYYPSKRRRELKRRARLRKLREAST